MSVAAVSNFGSMMLQDGDSSFYGVAVGDWANANARAGCLMCHYILNDTSLHGNTGNGVGDLSGIAQTRDDRRTSLLSNLKISSIFVKAIMQINSLKVNEERLAREKKIIMLLFNTISFSRKKFIVIVPSQIRNVHDVMGRRPPVPPFSIASLSVTYLQGLYTVLNSYSSGSCYVRLSWFIEFSGCRCHRIFLNWWVSLVEISLLVRERKVGTFSFSSPPLPDS
ncbi:hypothetical protein BT93_K1803 [Corymbia citriodora subsp. variegata]|nr:hypothetical protein BT93_K1803 [Corymbia citriodora subsp. variegata]